MFKNLIISVALLLPISVLAQSGDNGYTGAWLAYRGDALGASNAGTNIAASTIPTVVTNTPIIKLKPNTYVAFYPSFNLATNVAAASLSNVTFYFSTGPGVYTNNINGLTGSTNMTTPLLSPSGVLALNGTTNAIGLIVINPTNIIGGVLQFIGASTTATNIGGVNISNMPYFFYAQQ